MRISKKPEERQLEIIVAANRLFNKKGYEKTSVESIVKEVKIAKGTFYYHFKSKEDLLNRMFDLLSQKIFAEIEYTVRRKDLNAVSKMASIFREIFFVNQSDMDFLEDSSQFMAKDKNNYIYKKLMDKNYEKFGPTLKRVVKQGIKEKIFKVTYIEETVGHLMSIVYYPGDKNKLLKDYDYTKRFYLAKEEVFNKALGLEAKTIRIWY